MSAAVVDMFDEAWYRKVNPDVDAGIDAGVHASAWDHYCNFGRVEGRFAYPGAEEDRRLGLGIYAVDEADRRGMVEAYWSADAEETASWYWMAHPMVQTRLNLLASGDPEVDVYGHFAQILTQRGVALPIGRAVSLGCGFGGLERDLATRGIIREIDAYDIAPGAIAEAQRLAQEGGFTGLRYHVADLETEPVEREAVDVVFAHQSVHHVKLLDELFASVSAMLKPGGLFHLHEFVGPIRFQWTDAQIAAVNRFLEGLPPRLRLTPSGKPRRLQERPTIAAMLAADPSEAIRSSDIVPVLRRHFDIVEDRALGGALLHLGLADIGQNFDPASPDDSAILEAFFAAEDAAMASGVVGSDFRAIIAIKR